mgnify:CR=1 FL=1
MPVLTQPPSMGDVLKYELNPNFTRETITLLAGTAYPVGAVLGRITASGKYKLATSGGTDGAQTAAATLAQQSQDRLANPTTPEGLPTYTAPTLSTPTEQSIWERLLGPVTAAGGAYTGLQPTTQAPGARSITGGR